ncbi:hypothetical protein [Phycicoccus sonneratiae]|uniref:Uncharacterized protein n=1 Tax=Phycicoccus sonneratiae TaxID=2807628 RepID=A0ABS2CRN5_9MICO|nr:hypothetical protein [Phycicoccus sonneraticus]MBM6402460.1 hypothetical protein [Phycicoccus sonneraticus]
MHDETDEHDGPDQWSAAAREVLLARAAQLRSAVDEHVELVERLSGRQRELPDLFTANDALRSAAAAFDDAAFDLTGTAPLGLETWDDDDEDDEDWGEDGDPFAEGGTVVTVVGRWDYLVTDAAAVMEAGRESYLAHWTDDTEDDAGFRVQDVRTAVEEIMHGDVVHRLDESPGLLQRRFATTVITHDGDEDETFDDDPFAIVRAPEER